MGRGVPERRSEGDAFLLAMLPSSELGASRRLQALQQIVEYSELGPLVQVTYFSLLIHIYVHCFDSKARLCGFASLRALKRVRKWAHGFRTRGGEMPSRSDQVFARYGFSNHLFKGLSPPELFFKMWVSSLFTMQSPREPASRCHADIHARGQRYPRESKVAQHIL